MSNKTYNKWLKRVEDYNTPWTENEIIYFRKYMGSSSKAEPMHKETIMQRAFAWPYHITEEQTKKGIDYLRNVIFKKNGDIRNTKQNVFGSREIEIIKDFFAFQFVGIVNASGNSYKFYLPIYRVLDTKGNYFDYTTNMGIMEVV